MAINAPKPADLDIETLTAKAESYLRSAVDPTKSEAAVRMATKGFDMYAGEIVSRLTAKA
jgi:hypothetical protein